MSVPTIKEHLSSLESAGLVKQIDDGHKWKYYELTRKGKNILAPGETMVWVLLSLSGAAALGIAYDMISRFSGPGPVLATRDAGQMLQAVPEALPAVYEPAMGVPWIHIGFLVASTILFGATLGYYFSSRKKLPF